MKTVLKTKTLSSNSDLESVSEESSNVCQPSVLRAEQVEIYPGSNIFIDRLAWAVAQNANSASSFVRTLLTAVFPMDVLLVSNLRGKSRDSGDQRQALEKSKVDAIYRGIQEDSTDTDMNKVSRRETKLKAKRKAKEETENIIPLKAPVTDDLDKMIDDLFHFLQDYSSDLPPLEAPVLDFSSHLPPLEGTMKYVFSTSVRNPHRLPWTRLRSLAPCIRNFERNSQRVLSGDLATHL
ncbi:uncharacterized protein LOC143478218 isoform X2 [Brachyhypopomus gauderio]